ncbi:putative quinol monooxygenase, partial [Alteromonas portus]|uniref:putative quinol monooxygenase n=1 Tax=Alteromonas portus TaxID=2565549 RepID=UPI003BF9216A
GRSDAFTRGGFAIMPHATAPLSLMLYVVEKEVSLKKIILSGYIDVPNDQIKLVKSALPKHIELTQQENGCLTFKVTQRTNEPNIFDVYEEFVDKEAFEKHQKRVSNSDWGIASKNALRHYVITEV